MKTFLKYLICIIFGILIGLIINIPSCSKQPEPETQYIPVHDTITITKDSIIYKTKPIKEYIIDTFYVKESGDTIQLDSLPITEYKYQDTIKTDSTSTEIMINYHGFDAGIDSIGLVHNYFEKHTTVIKTQKRIGLVWYLGFDLGFGGQLGIKNNIVDFNYGPQAGFHVGIGIGGRIKQ